MDVSFRSGLALLAVLLAVARASEQLVLVHRSRVSVPGRPSSSRASLLTPAAAAVGLAYGHLIGADASLLVATWLNTAAAFMACALSRDLWSPSSSSVIGTSPGCSDE